jgi:cation diffusion facilitator family transporter
MSKHHHNHGNHDHQDHHEGHSENHHSSAGHGHSHTHFPADLYHTKKAFRAVQWGTAGLLITALLQCVISYFVNSAGLLADALHNLGDVFTTVALWLAFKLSLRQPNRRYPYGYHRVEDLTGVFIVLVIVTMAAIGAWESVQHLINQEQPTQLGWGILGGLIGFVGNEAVAYYKTKIGREINSVALVADGQHSRMDGLTSLAAVLGLVGVQLGFPLADPIAGIIITLVILYLVIETIRQVGARLLDVIDPELSEQLEQTVQGVSGVQHVTDLRARWYGRRLHIAAAIEVSAELSLVQAHAIAEEARHALLHQESVSVVDIHVDPTPLTGQSGYHNRTEHHLTGALSQSDPHDHDDHDQHGHDHGHKELVHAHNHTAGHLHPHTH